VDNGIVADFKLRHIVEADAFDDTAEVNPAHAEPVLFGNAYNFSWDS
jgi:hypothetical protein